MFGGCGAASHALQSLTVTDDSRKKLERGLERGQDPGCLDGWMVDGRMVGEEEVITTNH